MSSIRTYESPYPTPFLPHMGVFDFILPASPGISPLPDWDPSVPAYIHGIDGTVLRRGELRGKALQLATGLKERGLRRGDVACIWGTNSLEWIVAAFGCMAAGLVLSPANAAYAPHELAHQINDSGARVLFTSPENLAGFEKARKQIARPFSDAQVIVMCRLGSEPSLVRQYATITSVLGSTEAEPESFYGAEAASTALLCYSSGTTGLPKGVMTTHHNITTQVQVDAAPYPVLQSGKDAILGFLPLSHIYGIAAILVHPMTVGVPAVILPRWDEIASLKAIEKYNVSHVLMVPPVILTLIHSKNVDKYNLSSLRTMQSGAAPLGNDILVAFSKRFPQCVITQSYDQFKPLRGSPEPAFICELPLMASPGMSEASPGILMGSMADSLAGHTGVGRLIPGWQARLVREDGTDAPPGERGELWVRGPCVMKGYHANPDATAKTIVPGGWLRTGDVCTVSEDGFWHVVDRVKELIKYKGFQVAPAELEALLLQHPKIVDGGVVGVYDKSQATELPRAYIVIHPDRTPQSSHEIDALAKEVQAWVAARVAGHKKLVGGVILTNAIPKSPSGKILRNILRKRGQEEFEATVSKARL